jgi:hypothetical protein
MLYLHYQIQSVPTIYLEKSHESRRHLFLPLHGWPIFSTIHEDHENGSANILFEAIYTVINEKEKV